MPVKSTAPAPKPAAVVTFKPAPGKPAAAPAATAPPAEAAPTEKPPLMYKNLDLSKVKMFTDEDGPPAGLDSDDEADESTSETPPAGDDDAESDEAVPPATKPKSISEALRAKAAGAEEEPREPLSKGFLELTRKTQKLTERERAIEEREKKLTEAKNTSEALEQEFLADPLTFIRKRGYDYEKLTELVVSGKKPAGTDPETQRLQKELDKLKADQVRRDQESVQRENQAQISQFRADVKELVVTGGEKYELINALGEHQMVEDVIIQYAKETGEVADYELAAEYVEAELEQKYERGLKTKKISGKLKFSPVPQPSDERPSAIPARKGPRTLTNASTEAGADPVSKPLTREQRLHKAASVIRFDES